MILVKRRLLTLLLVLRLSAALLPSVWASSVAYMPGVTEEMTDPAFWSGMAEDPNALLSTPEEIARINAAALANEGSNMHDLRNLPDRFDGAARCASLAEGAAADAAYFLGWTYDENGKEFTQEDFDAIIANCADPNAEADMPVLFGVAVNRALLLVFPYDGQILDDPADLDFDYQGLVGIRVNEPVAAFTSSADGKYYQVFTSSCSGWVRKEDVAICASREEWLSAWDIPAEKRLVFWGDKLYTDESRTSPETSRRLITMGTVLERMEIEDPDALVVNRLPVHNYAVYLPVRNPDGSYGKTPALINAREALSEDYLPLTPANLAKVALASLGDAYGWGATLNSEDCTSLNRSIFRCFGLELPRNGNWLWSLDMPKADTTYMTTEEKEALLDVLPLGTLLDFPGHQMMYLGKVEGKYYCVNTVSSIMSPYSGKRQRARTVQINDLDIRRASGITWLQAVNHISLPWKYLAPEEPSPLPALPWYHEGTAFCLRYGLIDTEDAGYFRPRETADNAVALEALYRAAAKLWPESVGSEADPLRWAEEQGIIDAGFRPEDPLTREMLASLLYRAAAPAQEGGAMGLAGYEDSMDISDWAYEAMGWAVRCGILCGKGSSLICPKDPMTRCELALVLARAAALVLAS